MVRLYVNVQFQVNPLSTGTSSSQTKKILQQIIIDTLNPIPHVSGLNVPAASPREISGKSDVFTWWLNNFATIFNQKEDDYEKALGL